MELPGGSPLTIPPVRYIVGGASHPVISATAACPPRDWREYASCCPAGNTELAANTITRPRVAANGKVQRPADNTDERVTELGESAGPLQRRVGLNR